MVDQEIQNYYDILQTIDEAAISVTKWEADFLEGLLSERPGVLSAKQRDIIDRMRERYL